MDAYERYPESPHWRAFAAAGAGATHPQERPALRGAPPVGGSLAEALPALGRAAFPKARGALALHARAQACQSRSKNSVSG